MKRIIPLMLLIMSVASRVQSAPAYGTHMPEQYQFKVGAQGYSVLERKLEGTNGEMSSDQYFVLLSLGVTDWLSLDLKGGVGDIEQRPDTGEPIEYRTFLAGGYGTRLKLYDSEAFDAVFGFQHISVHPYSQSVNGIKHKAVLDDWQFSLLGSYTYKGFTPYAGTRWSRMDYIHWVDKQRNRVKSDETKSVGAIIGIDIDLPQQLSLNLEAQFVDARAFAASLNYHF